MIYSSERGILFTHVSRTGGTAITECLRRELPNLVDLLGQHAPLLLAKPILGSTFQDAFKFAIVRNPWDRFVSWYALIGKTQLGDTIADPDHAHWQAFDDFLEKWAADQYEVDGVRRRSLSQWAQLSDLEGKLLTDNIGRFETLNDDFNRIIKKFGLSSTILSLVNESPRQHYSVYYSNLGRELVGYYFRHDVDGFGYCFETDS